MRVAVEFCLYRAYYVNFDSQAHVERDHNAPNSADGRNHFNSHAHVERDATTLRGVERPTDFNSHAHVERDAWLTGTGKRKSKISTHTLTWSVTCQGNAASENTEFQLTRSRGA